MNLFTVELYLKSETLFIYLYRDEQEILNSYTKAKKLGYYLGWEEF